MLRAGLAAVDRQPDDDPGDGRATGVIGVQDLGEEGTEGQERGEDRVVVFDPLRGQGLLDHRLAEDLVEGESLRRIEGIPLAGNLSACSLGHGWSPCEDKTRVQLSRLVPKEAALCLSPCPSFALEKYVCHSPQSPFPTAVSASVPNNPLPIADAIRSRARSKSIVCHRPSLSVRCRHHRQTLPRHIRFQSASVEAARSARGLPSRSGRSPYRSSYRCRLPWFQRVNPK